MRGKKKRKRKRRREEEEEEEDIKAQHCIIYNTHIASFIIHYFNSETERKEKKSGGFVRYAALYEGVMKRRWIRVEHNHNNHCSQARFMRLLPD